MNGKKKKVFRAVIILIAIGIIYLGVITIVNINRGNVDDVNRSMAKSSVYSEEDILDAMDFVQNHFYLTFDGCTLTDLWYSGDKTVAAAEKWAAQYDRDEAIVLLSNFDVDSSGGDGSLNPNSTYTNWQWVLARDEGEEWVLVTWGY